MKRVIALTIVILFSVSVVGAYAGGLPQDAQKKGSWCDKGVERHVFQDPADGIRKWHTTAPSTKHMSLRGNNAELKKRRHNKMLGIV